MPATNLPKVGLGLWKVPNEDAAQTVYDAIAMGYRHLDSACDYGNEVEVGEGIARALTDGLCKREDLWVTSKLWNTYHAPEHVKPAFMKSLNDLGLDYLDLYMVHFPIALAYVPFEDRYPPEWVYDPNATSPTMKLGSTPLHVTWAAMEELAEEGLAKELGVCNYNSGLMHDLMTYARIKPTCLQLETHPYLTQERMLKLCAQYGVQPVAFSPLGALSYLELDMADSEESLLENEDVCRIAQRLGKTPAQVLLRWNIQRGCAILPKSSKSHRLKENLALFDFELSEQDMRDISSLNRNRRFNDPGYFCEAAFNTFHPIYD